MTLSLAKQEAEIERLRKSLSDAAEAVEAIIAHRPGFDLPWLLHGLRAAITESALQTLADEGQKYDAAPVQGDNAELIRKLQAPLPEVNGYASACSSSVQSSVPIDLDQDEIVHMCRTAADALVRSDRIVASLLRRMKCL